MLPRICICPAVHYGAQERAHLHMQGHGHMKTQQNMWRVLQCLNDR
jgi:hypothetical protein